MFWVMARYLVIIAALSSATLPVQGKKPARQEGGEEIEYSPYTHLTARDGYIFFGLANTNGSVPQPLLYDSALKFPPVAITTFLIARFNEGPLGPGDLISYIVEDSLDYNNKTLSSGSITVAYSSNSGYCNPLGTGRLKDRCFVGDFNWTTLDGNCENLEIYDSNEPRKLVLGFKRLCKTSPLLYIYDSAYMFPRLSALRLLGFNTFVAVTEGVTTEGQPKIVDHVLGDFDMDFLVGLSSFEQMFGPAVSNFVGFTIPVGFGVSWAKVRWGYNYISPLQQSFATILGYN